MADMTRFIAEFADAPQQRGDTFIGVELLAPGMYNGTHYTDAYIQQLVGNMQRLEEEDDFQPAYISGHTDDDEDWADIANDEERVIGHWGNHRIEDNRYLADLTVYDPEVRYEIHSGKRRYTSPELYSGYQFNDGTVGPFMPLAAGVVAPANTGASILRQAVNLSQFPDLEQQLPDESPTPDQGESDKQEGGPSMGFFDVLRERLGLGDDADEDALADALLTAKDADDAEEEDEDDEDDGDTDSRVAELEAKVADQDAKLAKRDERIEALEQARADGERDAAHELADARLAGLMDSGHITPAQRDKMRPIARKLATEPDKLAVGDDEVSALDAFIDAQKEGRPVIQMSTETTVDPDESEELAQRADEAAKRAGADLDNQPDTILT